MTPGDPAERLADALDGEWRTARTLAVRAGLPARGVGQRLQVLVRGGIAEQRKTGAPRSMRANETPREYRRATS